MKILNNRYRIIKKTPYEIKNDRCFIVEDLSLQKNRKLELKTLQKSLANENFMKFIHQKFILLTQLQNTSHMKNYDFTRLINIDEVKPDEDIYLYTIEHIEQKKSLLNFLEYATNEDIVNIFLLIIKELNYLVTYGIIYNYFDLNNVYVINKNNKINIKIKDIITIKLLDINQITYIPDSMISNFSYNHDIVKNIILSLLLKKNITKSHDRYFYELQHSKINEIQNTPEKKIYACLYNMYLKLGTIKPEQRSLSFYEIVSNINHQLNMQYNISTPINIINRDIIHIHYEKEKKEIFSAFNQIKAQKLSDINFLISAEFGMGKTNLLEELKFLFLLEDCDVYHIQNFGDIDDDKFIISLMQNLFIRHPRIQKNHENEIQGMFNTLKKEIEKAEDINKINMIKYKLINHISTLIIEKSLSNIIIFIIDDIHLINEFVMKTILYITMENIDKKNLILIQSTNETFIQNNSHAKKLIETLTNHVVIKKIQLNSLSEQKTETFMRNILNIKNIPDVLLKKIHTHTSGHPLFIKEALNELIASNDLIKDKATELCKISTDLSNPNVTIPISKNIEQAVKNQIKNLNTQELKCLQSLCIFKNSFRIEYLPKILNISKLKLEEHFSTLLKRNVIKNISKHSSDEYSVTNKILQKALYMELDDNYKIKIHRNILKTLDGLKSVNVYEFIWHAENSKSENKAIDYCIKNKVEIKKQYTPATYISIFEKIYTFTQNAKNNQKLDILSILIEAYLESNAIIECEKKIQIAKSIAETGQSNKTSIAQLYILDLIFKIQKFMNPEIVKKAMQTAEEFTAESDDEYTKLFLDKGRVKFLQYIRKYDESINEAKKLILKCGKTKKFIMIKVKTLLDIGNNFFHSGQYKKAEKSYLEVIELAKSVKDINIENSALNNLAVLQEKVNKNFELAIKYYNKILKNNSTSNNISLQILVLINTSIAYSHLYDYTSAYNLCNQAIKKIKQSSSTDNMFFTYTFMYDIYVSLCMYDKAYELQNQIAILLKNRKIVKRQLDLKLFYEMKNTYYYMMGQYKFEKKIIYKTEDTEDEIKNSLINFSILCTEINKLIQDRHISTKKIEILLKNMISSPIFYKNVYLFFYELIIRIRKIIIFRPDIDFNKIIKLILKIKIDNKAPLIKAALLFLESYIDNKNEEKKLIEASKLIENSYTLDLSIDINIKLGLLYLKKNNTNMAMVNFLEAQKLINIIIKKIPKRFIKTYFSMHRYGLPSIIIDDYINKRIKNQYKNYYKEMSFTQITKLLSKNTVDTLKNNQVFISNIIAQKKEKTPFKNKSAEDVVKKFTNNFLQNIKLLLNFTAINMLAEAYDIFIITGDNKIESLFNFGQSKTIEKIASLLASSTYQEINISKDGSVSSHLVIPINRNENNQIVNTTIAYLVFVSNKEINNFGNFGINFCLNFENIFAFLIESYKAQQEASTDKLTSALTRKYTETVFKEIIHTSQMNNKSFALLMYDLDHFKQINDKFGHQVGDIVLKTTAKTTSNILKKHQILGRIGGEEFIVIIPDILENEALIIAEKIRKQIETLNFDDPNLKITISIGIAIFPKNGTIGKELLSKADQALYTAKNTGRNKAVLWKEELKPLEKNADKLAGILTGNTINDTKNILTFIDTASLVRGTASKNENLDICLERIIDIIGADGGTFIITKNIKGSKKKFTHTSQKKITFSINNEFINRVMNEKKEICEIDWENISEKNEITGIPNWNSTLLVPVIRSEEIKAIIYLVIELRKRKFGIEDSNLVNLFASLIAPLF